MSVTESKCQTFHTLLIKLHWRRQIVVSWLIEFSFLGEMILKEAVFVTGKWTKLKLNVIPLQSLHRLLTKNEKLLSCPQNSRKQASADQLHCLPATINIIHQRFIIIIIIINIHSSCWNTSAWLHYSHHSSRGREKKENQSDGDNMWKSFTATQRTHLSSTTTEAENLSTRHLYWCTGFILNSYFWPQTWILRIV